MTPDVLDVHLNDEHVGTLTDVGMGYASLDFVEEALLARGVGSRALSLSLPFTWETVSGATARPYFEGLLPEGSARERIARARRISSADSFALLRELGRDCAGALTIAPPGERETLEPFVLWLTEDELVEAVEQLPDAPLGVASSGRVRLSLAGVEDKLVVVVREDGVIGLPLDGRPSTHILKPASTQRDRAGALRFPGIVENEAFCMRLAAASGIESAAVTVRQLAGERALLIERFDRATEEATTVRVHQEDACQALGVEPAHKYEEHGGPSVATVCGLLREFSATPIPDLYAFLDLLAFNAIVGNCDAHGKNYAVLHLERDAVRLAPAYDVVSTAVYPEVSTRLAMAIGGAEQLAELSRDALEGAYAEAEIGATIARRRTVELEERVRAALEPTLAAAEEEGWRASVVDAIAERVQTTRLL